MNTVEEWVKSDTNLARLAKDFYDTQSGKDPWEEDETLTPKPPEMEPPTEGFIKEGGWGANQDPKVWKVTSMKDKPEMFKVVDDADKNVATDFTTEDNANYYIEYYQWLEQNPEPEPEPGPEQPAPSGELDKEGVLMFFPTKAGTKEYYTKDYEYKRSSHGQASKPELGKIPRDTYWLDGVEFMQGEYTFIGKIDFTSPDDFSFKVGSLNHSGNDPDGEGCCYSFGISSVGTVHMSKETPRHPKTPNFDKKVVIEPGMPKSLGQIRNKTFGCKGVFRIVDGGKNVQIDCYVDTDPIDAAGKPKNNWKKWFTAKDDGSWENKPQTTFAKGNTQKLFHRIDNVGAKTIMNFGSARAI